MSSSRLPHTDMHPEPERYTLCVCPCPHRPAALSFSTVRCPPLAADAAHRARRKALWPPPPAQFAERTQTTTHICENGPAHRKPAILLRAPNDKTDMRWQSSAPLAPAAPSCTWRALRAKAEAADRGSGGLQPPRPHIAHAGKRHSGRVCRLLPHHALRRTWGVGFCEYMCASTCKTSEHAPALQAAARDTLIQAWRLRTVLVRVVAEVFGGVGDHRGSACASRRTAQRRMLCGGLGRVLLRTPKRERLGQRRPRSPSAAKVAARHIGV